MKTLTATRQARKVNRTVNLHWPITSCVPGLMTITEGARKDEYDVLSIGSDFGTAFEVTKHGGETYHVCLNWDGAGNSTCDCKGHMQWGHKTVCRHVAALTALKNAGKL